MQLHTAFDIYISNGYNIIFDFQFHTILDWSGASKLNS